MGEQARAFAALAMGLNGLLTAILTPVKIPVLGPLLTRLGGA